MLILCESARGNIFTSVCVCVRGRLIMDESLLLPANSHCSRFNAQYESSLLLPANSQGSTHMLTHSPSHQPGLPSSHSGCAITCSVCTRASLHAHLLPEEGEHEATGRTACFSPPPWLAGPANSSRESTI
jgi:hypothetical protein